MGGFLSLFDLWYFSIFLSFQSVYLSNLTSSALLSFFPPHQFCMPPLCVLFHPPLTPPPFFNLSVFHSSILSLLCPSFLVPSSSPITEFENWFGFTSLFFTCPFPFSYNHYTFFIQSLYLFHTITIPFSIIPAFTNIWLVMNFEGSRFLSVDCISISYAAFLEFKFFPPPLFSISFQIYLFRIRESTSKPIVWRVYG